MIPKTAIEKAIEGGWKPNYLDEKFLTKSPKYAASILTDSPDEMLYRIALDPSFWQALYPETWYEVGTTFAGFVLRGETDKFWANPPKQ